MNNVNPESVPYQFFFVGDVVNDDITDTVCRVVETMMDDEGTSWYYRIDIPAALYTDDYPNGWRHDGEISHLSVRDGDW